MVTNEKCNVGIADLNSLSLFEYDIFKAPGLEQSLQQVQVLRFVTVDTNLTSWFKTSFGFGVLLCRRGTQRLLTRF